MDFLRDTVQKQSKQITVKIISKQYQKYISIEWTLQDWLTYPNFMELLFKQLYDKCVSYMKKHFSEGYSKINLSPFLTKKIYDINVINSLRDIFQEDGFTMTIIIDTINNSYNVQISRN